MEKYYFKNYTLEYHDPRQFFMWFWLTHTDMGQLKAFDPVQNKLVVQIDASTNKPVETAYGLKTRKAHREKKELDAIFSEWENVFEKFVNDPEQLKSIGIIAKDKRRTISDEDALTVYARQNGKDAVTGQDMAIDDLVKGHVLAHSKGGESSVDNTVLINKFDNLKQGSEHFDQYMKQKVG
jgi:CRISPR/Cas system Type II protein with McrA/HNH and RuvC-like nuclease domain